jgi:hypothetical protein
VLFEIFSPIFVQVEPSRGSGISGVGVGVGVGVATGVGVGVGSTGLNTGFRFGFGAALTATPLFQTSLVPDLMHVNFLPPAVAVAPALVHFAPFLGVAASSGVVKVSKRETVSTIRNLLTFIFTSIFSGNLYAIKGSVLHNFNGHTIESYLVTCPQ